MQTNWKIKFTNVFCLQSEVSRSNFVSSVVHTIAHYLVIVDAFGDTVWSDTTALHTEIICNDNSINR